MKPQPNLARVDAALPAIVLPILAAAVVATGAAQAAPPTERPSSTKQVAPSKPPVAAPSQPPSKPREQAPPPAASKPRERPAPPTVKPAPSEPAVRKPVPQDRVDRPVVAPPRETKPRETKPREEPPREKPAPRPSAKPIEPAPAPPPARPEPRKPITVERDDKPVSRPPVKPVEPARPEPRKPITIDRDEKPIVAPSRPGTAIIEPSKPREERDARPAPRAERPLPKRPTNPAIVERARPIEDRDDDLRGSFNGDTVHGVPVARPAPRAAEPARNRHRDRDDRDCHERYVRNIARCNGWWYGSRWSDCGPCYAWQPYHCDDGVRVSIGFGSGFSFGFFYGTSCAPLCSSWCNPWWDGYATWWSCRPSWSWHTAWCRPWNSCWSACGPCPLPAWTPCYAYSPVVYRPVVVQPQPVIPNPDAMWAFLADGYDRDAEDGFILLEAAEPNDQRWVLGQAVARAFRGETDRAADLFRGACVHDPSALLRLSRDPKFVARLEALERSLDPIVQCARPSTDALVTVAASQAARGALSDAYLNATTASAEGDRSVGTANLISWLRAELRRTP